MIRKWVFYSIISFCFLLSLSYSNQHTRVQNTKLTKNANERISRTIASENENSGQNTFKWMGYTLILALPLLVGIFLSKKGKNWS